MQTLSRDVAGGSPPGLLGGGRGGTRSALGVKSEEVVRVKGRAAVEATRPPRARSRRVFRVVAMLRHNGESIW